MDAPGAREEYLTRIGRSVERTDWQIVSYASMSNHTHNGAVAGEMPPVRLFKSLHSGFARWLNDSENRLGPVFAERYKNITCEEESIAVVIAYIHNNPVRAGVVTSAELSTWTSHLDYLGERRPAQWLNVELGLSMAGFSSSNSGRCAFHDFVVAQASRDRDMLLSALDLDGDRARIRARHGSQVELLSPTLLGESQRLQYEIEHADGRRTVPRQGPDCCEIISAVAQSVGLTPSDLSKRTKSRRIVRARNLALIVWAVELRQPQTEMARRLGIASTTASQNLSRALASPELCELARSIGNAQRLAIGEAF